MFSSVLVVCIGNICRSPVAERLLKQALPDLRVESAGLGALVGHAVDATAGKVASEHGVDVSNHSAQMFSGALAKEFDLILVMEKFHLQRIHSQTPTASGKAMLLSHWSGQKDIPDPYMKSEEFHALTFDLIKTAVDDWALRLKKDANG